MPPACEAQLFPHLDLDLLQCPANPSLLQFLLLNRGEIQHFKAGLQRQRRGNHVIIKKDSVRGEQLKDFAVKLALAFVAQMMNRNRGNDSIKGAASP